MNTTQSQIQPIDTRAEVSGPSLDNDGFGIIVVGKIPDLETSQSPDTLNENSPITPTDIEGFDNQTNLITESSTISSTGNSTKLTNARNQALSLYPQMNLDDPLTPTTEEVRVEYDQVNDEGDVMSNSTKESSEFREVMNDVLGDEDFMSVCGYTVNSNGSFQEKV
ncbi:hypothetical protein TREMEDRAFT_58893 [Tremella mesenterica DSM 1558]|uniref:uncharacterized protein n=1 Tax=Tremella mesenterica (strain ATCC 24925 / CBS 8224 / DSM 1558 / NBRC 9311 / NRRL Y-6157 / RJB 2259-6 / UBC 559-6) TaxID=578456 RepID=UPI0003F492A0|nr:uncharacterized protein TREMEDRAFT_58893 [Tremella mesenterica DSM 1558]EIW72725.1 hypothetical protein TREMEDRAFT_58893 [Tremella mesenterica DSM 1558]